MSNTWYMLERTLARMGIQTTWWQRTLIVAVGFLFVMLYANNYILNCDGQTCTITKQKQLMGLFPKTVEQFEQADVKGYDFICTKHARHSNGRRGNGAYNALSGNKYHERCELQIILNDDTVINTHQADCQSKIGLEILYQDIKRGEIINRENWRN